MDINRVFTISQPLFCTMPWGYKHLQGDNRVAPRIAKKLKSHPPLGPKSGFQFTYARTLPDRDFSTILEMSCSKPKTPNETKVVVIGVGVSEKYQLHKRGNWGQTITAPVHTLGLVAKTQWSGLLSLCIFQRVSHPKSPQGVPWTGKASQEAKTVVRFINQWIRLATINRWPYHLLSCTWCCL